MRTRTSDGNPKIEGDVVAVARFLTLFSVPELAVPAVGDVASPGARWSGGQPRWRRTLWKRYLPLSDHLHFLPATRYGSRRAYLPAIRTFSYPIRKPLYRFVSSYLWNISNLASNRRKKLEPEDPEMVGYRYSGGNNWRTRPLIGRRARKRDASPRTKKSRGRYQGSRIPFSGIDSCDYPCLGDRSAAKQKIASIERPESQCCFE